MRRRCTGGKILWPPRPLFPGQGKVVPFPCTNHLGFPPSAFSELSPQSSALASRSRISLSPPGFQRTLLQRVLCTPPAVVVVGGERVRRLRAPGQEKRSARAYLANSLATPEQLRVPAGYLALIAQPGPNQGTRSRQCPGVGVGGQGICLVITWHKALRMFVPSVPQPARREESDVGLDPGPGELSNAVRSPYVAPCSPALLLGPPKKSDSVPSQASGASPKTPSPATQGKGGGAAWGADFSRLEQPAPAHSPPTASATRRSLAKLSTWQILSPSSVSSILPFPPRHRAWVSDPNFLRLSRQHNNMGKNKSLSFFFFKGCSCFGKLQKG